MCYYFVLPQYFDYFPFSQIEKEKAFGTFSQMMEGMENAPNLLTFNISIRYNMENTITSF